MRRNRKVTKMLAVLLGLVMMLSMIGGCGKKEETGVPDVTETEEKADKEEDVSVSPEEGEEQTEEEESEETEVTPLKLYPRDPGWDTVEYPTQGEQFEDIFIKHGMTVAEVVEAIENSEIEYTSEYDPEQPVIIDEMGNSGLTGVKGAKIEFFREGNEDCCINVYAIAYKDGMPLKDCIVTEIDPSSETAEINHEIDSVSRYIDGSSKEDIYNMGPDGVEALKDTLFKDYDYVPSSRSTSEGYNKAHVFEAPEFTSKIDWLADMGNTYYQFPLPEDAEITMFVEDDFIIEYYLDGPEIDRLMTIGDAHMYSNEDGYEIIL